MSQNRGLAQTLPTAVGPIYSQQGTFCSVSRRESRCKLRRSLINNKNTSEKSRIILTLLQCLSQELKKVRHMSHQAEKGETHVSPS